MGAGGSSSGSARLLPLALLLCVGALYAWQVLSYDFLNDDAFISFRYALNWAETGEVVYNLGERVEGYTNFLWVALLALLARLGGDLPQWARLLGPLFGALSLAGAYQLARLSLTQRSVDHQRLTSPSPSPSPSPITLALIAPLALALSPSFTCWSSGGLEVQLFTATLTWGFTLTLMGWGVLGGSLPSLRTSLITSSCGGALLAFATMTRPEGLMFVGLLALTRLAQRAWTKTVGTSVWPHSTEWAWGLTWLCLYAPYFMWRWRYYGYPLPNTYYVKTGAEGLWAPGGRYLLSWLLTEPYLLAPLLLGLRGAWRVARRQATPQLSAVIATLWTLGLCLHVARVGGDFMALHRFLVPIMPLLVALSLPSLALSLHHQSAQLSAPRRRLALTALSVLLLCAGGVNAERRRAQALEVGSQGGVDSIGWLKGFVVQCEQIGKWLEANTPPNTRLATTAAGALPFYAKRHTLDLLGLNDAWIAHNVPARGSRPGHSKSAPLSYVLQQKIDFLIYHPTMSARPPRAHPGFARALSPRGYAWRVFEPPHLTPRYWGVWVKSPQERHVTP